MRVPGSVILSVLFAVQLTLVAFALDAAAIQYTVTSWTESDGLPANAIRAIAQDQDGYLWLGTRAGLIRFDGVRFEVWETDSQAALTENDVTAVYAARDRSLWIGYGGSGGVSRLKDGRVQVYPSDEVGHGFVLAILEDRDGVIWAGGLGGLFRFRGHGWEAVGGQHGLSGETVLTLHQDRHDNIWVGASDGVFVRKAGADTFSRFARTMRLDVVTGFSEDAAGALWVADRKGAVVNLGSGATGRNAYTTHGLSSGVIHDAQGNLWIAQRGSGVLHVPRGHAATDPRSVHRFTIEQGLAGNNVSTLLEDREGNIWVATDGGLSRLAPSMVSSLSDGGVDNAGIAVTRDGSVWIANEERIVRFSGGRSKWYSQQEGLPGSRITALHTDRHGTLWAAANGGLARFNDGRFW